MRDRKWTDCPACGMSSSMRAERDMREKFLPPGYPPVVIDSLDGQFCETCGEGFWSLRSERRIARRLAEHRAQYDATRVVAAELVSVQEAAASLQVSVQAVHKMMEEGRLRFVYAAGRKFPIRKEIASARRLREGLPDV